MAYYPFELKTAILNSDDNNIILKTIKGALYEALIADFISKKGHPKTYFYKPGDDLEIEFIWENKDGVIPIEVKAGRKGTKSLDKVLESDDIPYAYKLADQNIGVSDKKITIPLWMMMFIDRS